MIKVPDALRDVASVLNNATTPDVVKPDGDGVALYSCGGPHFAPMHPKIGETFYCCISEQTYVYEEDIGHAGWKVNDKVEAHPAVVEREEQRIRDGLRKLAEARR